MGQFEVWGRLVTLVTCAPIANRRRPRGLSTVINRAQDAILPHNQTDYLRDQRIVQSCTAATPLSRLMPASSWQLHR